VRSVGAPRGGRAAGGGGAPGRRRGALAPPRLSASEQCNVELTGGDRAGGVVEQHLRAIAADRGALDRLARMQLEILGNESGGVRVMPADHRNASNRVGAAKQRLVRAAVLDG